MWHLVKLKCSVTIRLIERDREVMGRRGELGSDRKLPTVQLTEQEHVVTFECGQVRSMAGNAVATTVATAAS